MRCGREFLGGRRKIHDFAYYRDCIRGHRIVGKGSRLGPDLTEIGVIRTPEQLQESLVNPPAEVLPENRFFRVVTRAGSSVTGRLLNHAGYAVLLMDAKEQLRSFSKSELKEWDFVKGSTMPTYERTLAPQELAYVIAYLGTLKGLDTQ